MVGFLSNILSLFKGNPSSIIYILKKWNTLQYLLSL
jgi:hypothetical protein